MAWMDLWYHWVTLDTKSKQLLKQYLQCWYFIAVAVPLRMIVH